MLADFQPPPAPVNLVHSGGRLLPRKMRAFLDLAGAAAARGDRSTVQAQIRRRHGINWPPFTSITWPVM